MPKASPGKTSVPSGTCVIVYLIFPWLWTYRAGLATVESGITNHVPGGQHNA